MMGAIMTNDVVYHIDAFDEYGNLPITMSRDYAIELATYYANKENRPVMISMSVHGTARSFAELTIYPDCSERLDDGC